MISIAIPYYSKMKNAQIFLDRCLYSIREQTYQDYEIVVTEAGKMAENTNQAIKQCKGDYIKILYMDDYFADKHSLQRIVDAFKANPKAEWLISGCSTNHKPYWTDNIHLGNNKLGSPSVLTIKNNKPMLFDENLGWLLDCDYYRRMYDLHGHPIILEEDNVIIGVGDHQATNTMGDEVKLQEEKYMKKKYE